MGRRKVTNRDGLESALFEKLYFSPSEPSAFGGKRRFLQAVAKSKGASKELVRRAEQWLKGVDTYTLHKPSVSGKTKQRRPTIVSGIDATWEVDLADLPRLSDENDNNRYILFIIDVFSRFAWARTLQNKKGQTVSKAMQEVFESSKRKPVYIFSDLGKEFFNSSFQSLMKANNIHHYHTENRDTKASIVERLQRTIKDKLYRYFTHSASYRYIDILPNIMEAYNSSIHSSIAVAPAEVSFTNQEEVWNQQHHAKTPVYDHRVYINRLKPDDLVRVSKLRSVFEKGSLPKWTEEVFRVSKVLPTNPITYSILDMKDQPVAGSWYTWELQKIKGPDIFKVESVLKKKKTKGKWKYFVKFQGYNDSFNDWVDDIVEYKN